MRFFEKKGKNELVPSPVRTQTNTPQTSSNWTLEESNLSGLNGQPLCARCAELDLDRVLSTIPGDEGTLAMYIGKLPTRNVLPNCQLCRMLAAMRPQPPKEGELLALWAFPNGVFFWLSAGRSIILVVARVLVTTTGEYKYAERWTPTHFPAGFICPITPVRLQLSQESLKVRGRSIHPDRIDFNVLLGWLASCRTEHKGCSGRKGSAPIGSFNLIDCSSGEVIPVSDSRKYAALSYVWGQVNVDEEAPTQTPYFPRKFPRTIEDAIAVTRALGFCYLWIDRYCIVASNEQQRHSQIRQMDRIYQNAEITIVAAAGQDPNFGLPGVSKVPRIPQPKATVGSHVLVSTMSIQPIFPPHPISGSAWISRAWTFQEAILSRRLCIFTEQQVYFECHGMNCYEAVCIGTPDKRDAIFKENRDMDAGLFFLENLATYTKRKLTYDSDILNAFLGVLRVYGNAKTPTYHFWGVPVLPIMQDFRRGYTFERRNLPATRGFLNGLCWTAAPGRRRAGFPSWSWTGWTGKVGDDYYGSLVYKYGFKSTDIEVTVEVKPGCRIDWNEFLLELREKEHQGDLPRNICINSLTIPVRFKHLSSNIADDLYKFQYEETWTRLWVVLESTENYHRCVPLTLLDDSGEGSHVFTDLEHADLVIIEIAGTALKDYPNGIYYLVAREVGPTFERIGHIYIRDHYDIREVPTSGPDKVSRGMDRSDDPRGWRKWLASRSERREITLS